MESTGSLLIPALMLIVGIPILALFVRNWHVPFILLFLYLPISGWVAYRVVGPPAGLLVKDFAFALPAYVGFLVELRKKIRFSGIPQAFTLVAATFSCLVIVYMFNPAVIDVGLSVGLVGARVWLFYIPMLMLTYVYLNEARNFTRLNRIVCLTSWIPAPIGLVQYILSRTWSHQKTMELFWGDYAHITSHGYGAFRVGESFIARIPSTFTFAAQYGSFIIGALMFTFLVITLDPSHKWRAFGWVTLLLLVIAGLLCGLRAHFFLIPGIIATLFLLQRGIGGFMPILLFSFIILPLVSLVSGFSFFAGVTAFADQLTHNFNNFIFTQPNEAAQLFPLGIGTGMNTGAARHMVKLLDLPMNTTQAYESTFAKAIVEMGIAGGVIFTMLILTPWIVALKCRIEFKSKEARTVSTVCLVYLTFSILSMSKAYVLDVEPSCVYFWVIVGMLFRLNAYRTHAVSQQIDLERQESTAVPVHVG